MPTSTAIDYRWLHGDELAILEPILKEAGAMALNRETTRAIAAFFGDNLIGFFCLQFVPHLEPLYVDPAARGTDVGLNLVSKMVDFLKESDARGVMLFAENPFVEKLAENFGMERIHFPAYLKVNMGGGI